MIAIRALLALVFVALSTAYLPAGTGRLFSGAPTSTFSKISDPSMFGASPTVLQPMTVNPGVYTGVTTSRSYQLFRDGVAVPGIWQTTGAPSWTYIIVEDDLGTTITFVETVNKTAGGTSTATTNGVGTIVQATATLVKGNAVAITASGNMAIDGILDVGKWGPPNSDGNTIVTFSFPSSGSFYLDVVGGDCSLYSGGPMQPCTSFNAFSPTLQTQTRLALKTWQNFCGCGLYFIEMTETLTSHAMLRFARTSGFSTPGSYDPVGSVVRDGDVWFTNDALYNSFALGSFGWVAILHEIGHTLGLDHDGHDSTWGPLPAGDLYYQWSIMVFCGWIGQAQPCTTYTSSDVYPMTPMIGDIQAVQYLFGVSRRFNPSNTFYTWSPTTGEFFINGVSWFGSAPTVGNRIFMSIWDSGGTDTYDFTNYLPTTVTCNLTSGAAMTTTATQRATIAGSHAADGSIYNSVLNFSTKSCVPP